MINWQELIITTMRRQTDSYRNGEYALTGRRCQICVGCGRCPGVISAASGQKAVQVLLAKMIPSIEEGYSVPGYRMAAVDIGTTTIAMELLERDGRTRDSYVAVNPQTEYGADVLSRITAAQDLTLRQQMQKDVKSALAQGAERFLKCMEEDEKLLLFIAANTTMSYLFLGIDPEELGRAPFEASHLTGGVVQLLPRVICVLLPGPSAFVGGDIWAGIRALKLHEQEEITLLVDLGTNGEIALGCGEKIIACATAAGPAFEGGPNRGIWGADMVHLSAELLRRGYLDSTGLLKEPYFSKGIRIGNVSVTQDSIRALQCAKAAICAGIRILLQQGGISAAKVQRVVLAGGFGYYLKPEDAVEIGLIPKEFLHCSQAGGNTALAGAAVLGREMLKGLAKEEHILSDTELLQEALEGEQRRCGTVQVLNLAMQKEFQNYYIEAMELSEM